MGTWHLHVTGTGVHHNGIENDADAIAKRLVEDLKTAGHTIHNASFWLDNAENLNPPPPVEAEEPLPEPAAEPEPVDLPQPEPDQAA